ncbi:YibE/F family protein [Candidatus Dojkabacteria bacterium]|uniref:YibE/F family protein n=1 Tax=Candidatus Dojkabacteria bacterium TaxID=2099670 RepID=A0A847VCL4_9BACT|nr:YibE/F family protein [Candidatus Dojkabacteria bacterium]
MKYIKVVLLLLCVSIVGYSFLSLNNRIHAQEEIQTTDEETLWGKIVEVVEEGKKEFNNEKQLYQKLKVLVTKGSLSGEEIEIENGALPSSEVIKYHKGDRIIISHTFDEENNSEFFIVDFVRTKGLLILFLLFVLFTSLVGSKQGILSLLSMLISFVIILTFILPNIQSGKDPILISIIASIFIIPITFYLSHGFEKKVTVSIIGTIIALIITGILSHIFVKATYLLGTATEEILLLQTITNTQYNLKGLLLAGIIIGTLGVLDDVTVSQTSIVYQLYNLRKDLSTSQLFRESIKIGKDHIASMVNTLILVYTGASMPLLLLFMSSARPFEEVINMELISTEIVRTLVGSIGLILAVPITTYLACIWIKKERV